MTETEDVGDAAVGEAAVTLSVPEMDCPSCANKVDTSLRRLDGVLDADLDPIAGAVTVRYARTTVSDEEIIDAVEAAGYAVPTRHREQGQKDRIAKPAAVWTSPRALKTWVGAVFLFVGLVLAFLIPAWDRAIIDLVLYDLTVSDVLFIVAILASGIPVVRSGYYSARNRSLDIDLLMGTAIIAASSIGLFVEAATLAVLFSIAELLEQYAMDRTRDSLRELLELAPNTATVITEDAQRTVPVEEVVVGDLVAVRPGEKIPVDGVIRGGTSAVDQSPITGESVPVDKAAGDEVFAGTLNEAGYLEIEATSAAAESTLAQIIDLVRSAQAQKTKREQFVDRFASYYTPAVVVLAFITTVLPPILIDGQVTLSLAGLSHTFHDAWQPWFVRGLTLLVIACPCAFVISTPVSVASGVTAAARHGVLIKGGNYLEAMGEVDAIAFDKTGTLTKGALTVTDIVPVEGVSETEVLRIAGALERQSDHPIAAAILDRIEETSEDIQAVSGFENIPGKGLRADLDDTTYYVGKPELFADFGVDFTEGNLRTDGGVVRGEHGETVSNPAGVIETFEGEGKTIVLVGTTDRLLGIIGIADEVRPTAKHAIAQLHDLGVAPLIMLTGDNEGTARSVAREVGLDGYRAELLPDEKVEAVTELEAKYGQIAMVGDGINDAPAMATASIGIAMGAAGTDTAIETADIALMGDDIGTLPYLYALSHSANGVIRQNIWSSLGVKLVLALGVPFGYVSVAIAVLVGDMGMSLGVTGNAMRLSRLKPDRFLES